MGGEVQPQHLMFAPLEPDPSNLFIHQDDRYDDDHNPTPRIALSISQSIGCYAKSSTPPNARALPSYVRVCWIGCSPIEFAPCSPIFINVLARWMVMV